MRFIVSLLSLGALFVTSCANHGVIVQKESRPHPFYESVGIEGVYTFFLRDEAGAIHRQMVTPEVYERYAIGQPFNDEMLTPATNDTAEPKAVQVAMHRPTFAVGRLAQTTSSTSRHLATAKTSGASKSRLAIKTNHHATKRMVSQAHLRKKLVAARSKKSRTVALSSKTPKPWRLTAPTVESAAVSQPAPPAEGPIPKASLRETQVDIPDAP